MGKINLSKEGLPTAPATDTADIVLDAADGYMKAVDSKGVAHVLSSQRNGSNFIINGCFQINQRIAAALTNFTGTTTGRTITIDRWGHTTGNATTPQFQHVDTASAPETGLDCRFYGLYKQLTNAAKICVSQVIEGREVLSLRGKRVRLQVELRKTVGADKTICLGLLQLTSAGTIDTIPATFISAFNGVGVDPTFGTNLSLISPDSDKLDNTTFGTTRLNCAITSVWQRFSGVFLVPSNCKNLAVVVFSNDTLAVNDDLCISEVDLHEGQEINEYVGSSFADELHSCQRFFSKSFNYGVVPAQNAGLAGSQRYGVAVAGAVTTSWNGAQVDFPVLMRVAPTITFYNPSAVNAFVRNITLGTDATATSGANIGDNSAHINCTGLAAWAVGNDSAVHWSANAEL